MAVVASIYVKQSSQHALNTELNFLPSKEGDSLWFNDSHYQELLGIAYDKATKFYDDVQSRSSRNDRDFLTCIQRSGEMRVLCVFQKMLQFNLKGVLVKCEHSKKLAEHIFDVGVIQVNGKNVIPYMENCFTTRGLYKYYSLLPYQLQMFVDTNELTSTDGIISKYNSLDPSSPITNACILSCFNIPLSDDRATQCSQNGGGDTVISDKVEEKTKKKQPLQLKSRRQRKQIEPTKKKIEASKSQMEIDVAFNTTKKKKLLSEIETPEEIVISETEIEEGQQDQFEFPDNVPDSIFEQISHQLEESEKNSNQQQDNNNKHQDTTSVKTSDVHNTIADTVTHFPPNKNDTSNGSTSEDEDFKLKSLSVETRHDKTSPIANKECLKDVENRLSIISVDDSTREESCNSHLMADEDSKKQSCIINSAKQYQPRDSLSSDDGSSIKDSSWIPGYINSQSRKTGSSGASGKGNFRKGIQLKTRQSSQRHDKYSIASGSRSPPTCTATQSTSSSEWITRKTCPPRKQRKKMKQTVLKTKPAPSRSREIKLDDTSCIEVSEMKQTVLKTKPAPSSLREIKLDITSCIEVSEMKQTVLKTKPAPSSLRDIKLDATSCIEVSDDEKDNVKHGDSSNDTEDDKLLALNNERIRTLNKRIGSSNRIKSSPSVITNESQVDDEEELGDEIEIGFYEIVPVSSGDEASDSCDEFSSLSTEKKRKLGPKRKAKMREIFEGYSEIEEVSLRTIHKWVALRRETLVKIFKGEIPTERHELFKKGPRERRALQYNVSSVILSEEQFAELTNCLNKLFCTRNASNFTYMYSVIVAESIIYMLMDFYRLNYCEAEYKMLHFHRVKREKMEF